MESLYIAKMWGGVSPQNGMAIQAIGTQLQNNQTYSKKSQKIIVLLNWKRYLILIIRLVK